MEGLTDEEVIRKDHFFNELTMIVSRYPDPEVLNTIPVNTGADIFFEVLSHAIMNTLKSFQGWLSKLGRAKKSSLITRLEKLKENYTANTNNIFILEHELNSLVEADISNKTESLKIFENLNSEKPTPLFLNLTKNRSCAALDGIHNTDGSVFNNDTERQDYIFSSIIKTY
jgi:hypothetical protein